jgi:hypothetical protein
VALRARGEILAELGDAKKAMLDLSLNPPTDFVPVAGLYEGL